MCFHIEKLRGKAALSFHQDRNDTHSHTGYLRWLCRAGYLTLFGGEQNNNGADPSSVYEGYRTFDGLLTKLARGTLKSGNNE